MGAKQFIIYLRIIMVILFVIIAIGGLCVYYFAKVKKRTKVTGKQVDYDNLNKKDSIDFCKFNDIDNDMIITNNGNRYVAAIRARGYDFFQARADERNRTEGGYGAFLNTITEPIQFRQYTKAIDLDGTYNTYQKAYNLAEETLYNLSEDFNQLRENYYDLSEKGEMKEDVEWEILSRCEELAARIQVYEWRRAHLKDNLEYIELTSRSTQPEKVQTYVFDWQYDPLLGVADLSDQEIEKKASTELQRRADNFIHALSNAGVKASRVRTNDLMQMMRRHFHPYTANIYTGKDIDNSNFDAEITSSTALRESDYEIALENGTLSELQGAQDEVFSDMISRGIEIDVAEKISQSYSAEQLLDNPLHEEEKNRVGVDEITARKDEILTNKFEERENKRIKEEKNRQEREKRAMGGKPEDVTEKKQGNSFAGLEFEMPDSNGGKE